MTIREDLLQLSNEDWLIHEKGFNPDNQGMYEALLALGNGYLTQRAALEENPLKSYRGTYMAGVFDKSESYVTQLVKLPGWNDFSVWIEEEKFSFETCSVLSHERTLDMRKGILHRATRFKDKQGRIIKLETKRICFTHQVRGALMLVNVTPENFSGEVKVISGLNGDVTNHGYYPNEKIKHLNLVAMKRGKDHIYLETATRDKNIRIALAASIKLENPPQEFFQVNRMFGEKFAEMIVFKAKKGETYNFTKLVAVFTSREGYERQLESACIDLLHDMLRDGIEYHLGMHVGWREKDWERADIVIKGDEEAQRGIRFNIYHLLIAKPHHDSTLSIGAKFLTGEGYRGHVFWDTELFIFPFYAYTFPNDALNLMLYRYYTQDGAMRNAQQMGYRGAKIAWESADTGDETTPNHGILPDGSAVRIFTGDEEHHIVSDVALAISKYYDITGDKDFMYKFGAEVIFQTALFWLSRVERRRNRYEIRKVIGPDEFHEHVDNNAFTNYLVMWHLGRAVELYKKMEDDAPQILKKLCRKIKLLKKDVEKMSIISKVIFFPYDQTTEIIEQFEGYFTLEDHIIEKRDRDGNPIVNKDFPAERFEKTKLIKQADVVLLLYLFPDRFSPEVKIKNYDYYEKRTMHKSSLSYCSYALMGLEVGDHRTAYDYFIRTSHIDLYNIYRNTCDGIHAAAAGGTWQMVVHGFAGMKPRRGVLCFDPWLPEKWKELSYTTFWQENKIKVRIEKKLIELMLDKESPQTSLTVKVHGESVALKPGKPVSVKLEVRK